MSEDITNQILKLIDPLFQQGYTGEGVNVDRVMSVFRRLSKIEMIRDVCHWHMECEKQGWGSQASIVIDYDDDRPYVTDGTACLLDREEKDIADRLVETLDQYGSSEPNISGFIDAIVKVENAASWSILGWRQRLEPLAGSIGFDLHAYCSACAAQDLQESVDHAPQVQKPGARM